MTGSEKDWTQVEVAEYTHEGPDPAHYLIFCSLVFSRQGFPK